MAGLYSIISIISFVLAGVLAVLAIVLVFVLKIPAVIGDLSGRTAKKSIETMRQRNEQNRSTNYHAGERVLEKMKATNSSDSSAEAVKKAPPKAYNKPMNGENGETGLLTENLATDYESVETGILDESETAALDGTTELGSGRETIRRTPSNVRIELISRVMLVNTDEVI